jgi:uncharacterized membrane protein
MIIVATLVVSLAAALHVAIFIMESIGWTRPGVLVSTGRGYLRAAFIQGTLPLLGLVLILLA